MTATEKVLQYEDWLEQYSPALDPSDASLVQYPTWNSLPEGVDIHHVWAVMEGEDPECTECTSDAERDDCEHDIEPGDWAILPGYHLVNIVYFVITKEPWADTDDPIHVIY